MKERSLEVFVEGVAHYFDTLTDSAAQIGTPFLTTDINKYLYDYTCLLYTSDAADE